MLPSGPRGSSLPTPTPSLSNLNRTNQTGSPPPSTQTQGNPKRGFSALESEIVASQTSSQKRTKVIEAALAPQKSTKLELAPSPSQRRTKIIQNVLAEFALSQSHSQGPRLEPAFYTPLSTLTDDLALADSEVADLKELRQDVRTGSEAAVLSSQQGPPQVISTSKISDCSSAYDGDQKSGVPNIAGVPWVPQTPKRTEQDPSVFTGLTSPSPSPIQNTKGKQNASACDSTRNKPSGSDQVSFPLDHSSVKRLNSLHLKS